MSTKEKIQEEVDVLEQEVNQHEIVLYNDTKLVYSDKNVIFTSNRNDTLYGVGFWSNYDMSSSKILKPIGVINK